MACWVCSVASYVLLNFQPLPTVFLRVKESCHLLTMQLGDALLLKSTLSESLHSLSSQRVEDPVSTVQEQGIYRLSPEEVELVLSRRNDLLRNY